MVKSRSGFTLAETLVTFGIMSLILALLAGALLAAGKAWRRTSGLNTVETQLGKAQSHLVRDLESIRFDESATTLSTAGLAGVPAGTAIWFLSAVDPATETAVRTPFGAPLWQRNILIYPAVPLNHDSLFGMTCTGGAGPLGLDDQCPHKVLIRKVIDGPVSHPDIAGAEGLLSAGQIANYLTRPQGFDTSNMSGEAGLEDVSFLANFLLFFSVERGPAGGSPLEVQVDIRALNIEDARRNIPVGNSSLADSRFTSHQLFSIYPRN